MQPSEKKNTTAIAVVAVVAVLALGFYLFSQNNMNDSDNSDGVMVGGALMTRDRNIVENAMNADNVTTVVAAVKAAGLADTLMSDGPFTVFAPTNAAFEKLPAGTVDTLLMEENKDMLVNILTYHVVPGKYESSDLSDGQKLTTVQGQELTITMDGDMVMVNGVEIETADVISSNGVTHVIGSVLMPKEGVMVGGALMTADMDIVENAMNASNVTTVVAAVQAAGLVETLRGEGPLTVFAPNNAAFEKLPDGTVENLLMAENKSTLVNILTYHVVAGRYTSEDLTDGMELTTVQGQKLMIGVNNGMITVNGTTMVETKDVISSNGVTFVIDSVLMPQ